MKINDDFFIQYAICGNRNGKWYREHPNFEELSIAKDYFVKNKNQFKYYDKVNIQCRKISKWEDATGIIFDKNANEVLRKIQNKEENI